MEVYKNLCNFLTVTDVVGVRLPVRIVLGFQATSIVANKQLLVVGVEP